MHAGDHQGRAGVTLDDVDIHNGHGIQELDDVVVTHPSRQDKCCEAVLVLCINLEENNDSRIRINDDTRPQAVAASEESQQSGHDC